MDNVGVVVTVCFDDFDKSCYLEYPAVPAICKIVLCVR
jgi:hypothetical protein